MQLYIRKTSLINPNRFTNGLVGMRLELSNFCIMI